MPDSSVYFSVIFSGIGVPGIIFLITRWMKSINHPINQQLKKAREARRAEATEPKDFTKYVYRNRYIPYFGRKKELQDLEKFLTSKEHFKWWLICGSGGSGKSRLALEFCHNARGKNDDWDFCPPWDAVFLNVKDFSRSDWESWKPCHDTLLVIDYAASAAEQNSLRENFSLANLLVLLAKVSQRFCSPRIRVLLLEREYRDSAGMLLPWYIRLARNTGGEYTALESGQFLPPLELGKNMEDAEYCAWRIMEHVLSSQSPPLFCETAKRRNAYGAAQH